MPISLSKDSVEENVPFLVEINVRCRPMDGEGNVLQNQMVTTKQSFVMLGKDVLGLQDLIQQHRDLHGKK